MVLNTPLNPLLTNIPILYPLKTLENQRISGEWEYWTEMGYLNLVKTSTYVMRVLKNSSSNIKKLSFADALQNSCS